MYLQIFKDVEFEGITGEVVLSSEVLDLVSIGDSMVIKFFESKFSIKVTSDGFEIIFLNLYKSHDAWVRESCPLRMKDFTDEENQHFMDNFTDDSFILEDSEKGIILRIWPEATTHIEFFHEVVKKLAIQVEVGS